MACLILAAVLPYPRSIQREDHGQASQPGQASDAPSPPDGASRSCKHPGSGRACCSPASAVQFSYHPWAVGDTTHLLSLAKIPRFQGHRDRWLYGSGASIALWFIVGVDLLYGIVGANLTVFKAITIVQFAGILWCLVALCRVGTGYQALAACLALSCFVGLHTSRILFGFFPTQPSLACPHGSAGASPSWACAHIGPGYPACYFAVCLALPLAHRDGAAAASDAGVPVVGRGTRRAASRRRLGSGRRDAVYVVVRTTFSSAGADIPWILDGSGLGFGQIEPDGFSDAFGQAPYLFWVYNVMASLITVLFSEPRGGTFEFIHSLIEGNTPPWRWIHLATSLVTTSTGIVVLMRQRLEGHRRQLLVLGCILILSSSLLGFLYARDRVVVVAGAGYALLVFLMASLLVESVKYRRAGSVALVVVLLIWLDLAQRRIDARGPRSRLRVILGRGCVMSLCSPRTRLTPPCSRRCTSRRSRHRHLIRTALRAGRGAISSDIWAV